MKQIFSFWTVLKLGLCCLVPASFVSCHVVPVNAQSVSSALIGTDPESDTSFKGPGYFGNLTIDVRLLIKTHDRIIEETRQTPFSLVLPKTSPAPTSPYLKVQKIVSLNKGETLINFQTITQSAEGLGKFASRKLYSRKYPTPKILLTAYLNQNHPVQSYLNGQLTYKISRIQKGDILYDTHISLPNQADFILLESAVPNDAVAYIYDFEDNLLSRGMVGESAYMRKFRRLARLEHYNDPDRAEKSPVTILRVIPWNISSSTNDP